MKATFLLKRLAPVLPVILSLVLCACARPAQRTVSADELVDHALQDASSAILRDLAILNGSEQHTDPAGPAPESRLRTRLSLAYDGPLRGALEKICAATGMELRVTGKEPVPPCIVHIRAHDEEAYSILRATGLQSGPSERIRVLEQERAIELEYRAKPASSLKAQRGGNAGRRR